MGHKPFTKNDPRINRKGRPRSPEIHELRHALKAVRLKQGKSFLMHFIERAYENDVVAIALAKKIIPDKIETKEIGKIMKQIVLISSQEIKNGTYGEASGSDEAISRKVYIK